jgi:hypothetical protein
MNVTGDLTNYQNAVYDISVTVNNPLSGFEFSLAETGKFYSSQLVTFSGVEGYLFDQSGNFFGGYASGTPFDLTVYHDYANNTFSYYKDEILIANKLDITGASKGATDNSINCVFLEKNDSQITVAVSGQSKDSLAKHATSQVNARFDSGIMDVATNASMLSSFTDPNGTLTAGGFNAGRADTFWAKDIDFTSVSVWNNRGYDDSSGADFRKRGATAITKRHIIMAKHFKLQASDVVYFVDPDGTWISRTISAIADHGSEDMTVGVLSESLPDNISFVKILSSNVNDFLKVVATTNSILTHYRPIIAGFDFEKKLTLMELTNAIVASNSRATYNAVPAVLPDPYGELAETLASGDSGQPAFIILNGEPVLITSYHTTTYGPSYAGFIAAINTLIASADSTAGVDTKLKVTEFNMNTLDLFKF